MKKILIISLIFFIYFLPNVSFAEENTDAEDVLSTQQQSFGIGEFLSEAKKYTSDIDVSELFNSVISGNLDNTKILKYITNILGDNLKDALKMISGVIVVIIVHSILKTISENLKTPGPKTTMITLKRVQEIFPFMENMEYDTGLNY